MAENNKYIINGEVMDLPEVNQELNLHCNPTNQYHFILDNTSVNVSVLHEDVKNKTWNLSINNKPVIVQIEDKFDQQLKQMGIGTGVKKNTDKLLSPMPGLILKLHVNVGDTVVKGQTLLTLEAMKMENNLKASHDAKVKEIPISAGQNVEKGQTLLVWE